MITGRPGRDPGQLDRGLDRLGAGVREERAPRAAGQQPAQALVEPQPRLVVDDVLLAVEELRRLGLDGGHDARMGVAGVRDADPGRVVEVALAVRRDQPRALAAVDLEVRDPAPDRRDDGVVGEGSRSAGVAAWPGHRRRSRSRAVAWLARSRPLGGDPRSRRRR